MAQFPLTYRAGHTQLCLVYFQWEHFAVLERCRRAAAELAVGVGCSHTVSLDFACHIFGTVAQWQLLKSLRIGVRRNQIHGIGMPGADSLKSKG